MSRSKRKTPVEPADGPTQERVRHGGVVFGDDPRSSHRLHSVRSPLDRMKSAGWIDTAQHAAGERYARHWHAAGVAGVPRGADLNRAGGGAINTYGMAASEAQAWHRMQYRHAAQVVGSWRCSAFEAVVCHGEPLDAVGLAMGERNKVQAIAAAREMVRGKLHTLAELWGLAPGARRA